MTATKMNAQEIIQFIANAEKKTSVKVTFTLVFFSALAINWMISWAFIFVAVIGASWFIIMIPILPKKASNLKP